MATVARLNADLVANTSSFEMGLKRANSAMNQSKQQWNNALSSAGRSFNSFGSQVQSSISSIGSLKTQLGGFVAASAGAFSVQKIINYSDTYKMLDGRLKLATDSTEQFASVSKDLFNVAQSTSTPLSANIEAFSRLSQSLSETEKKQYDLVGITETLSQTLALSGTSGQAAGELIRQFGQAASSDFKAVGQEIGSIQDQAPRLAKLLSEAFKDSGKSLKQLAEDGELSTTKVLNALVGASGKIKQEFDSQSDTVSKAMTRLDNAFLSFIGKSDLVNQGSSSIASAIGSLANNFDKIGLAAGVAAAVFAGRLIPPLIVSSNLMLANATSALALNVAMGRLAFGSTAAGVGMTALAGATSLAQGAMALAGGPVGVALIGILAVMVTSSNKAKDAQAMLNKEMEDFSGVMQGYINASAEGRKKIEDDVDARIKAYEKESLSLQEVAKRMENQNVVFRALREQGSKWGIDSDSIDVLALAGKLSEAANKLKEERAKLGKEDGPAKDSLATTQKQKKAIDDTIASLKQEADQQRIRASMQGQSEAAIDRAIRAQELQNKFTKDGINLGEQERATIDELLISRQKNAEAIDRYKESKEASDKAEKEHLEQVKKAQDEIIAKEKTRADIFQDLQDQTSVIKSETDAYGQKASAVSRASKEQEMHNKLTASGITLSAEQRKQLDQYLDNFEKVTELQKKQTEEQKNLEDAERNRQQVMNEFAGSFESAFEDAIVSGEKFSDVINGLTQDLIKMLLRANITQPLVSAVTAKGGIFDNIGSFLFGGVPSHATGTDYVPRDMLARVHKGEMIMPAREVNKMGGGDIQVNIINNAGVDVKTSPSENGMGLNVMIDQAVANNIANKGSRTNQALQAHANRTLTRR